jgi:hypothetical protein
MIVHKACKSKNSFLLEGGVAQLCSLHDRSHNSSPATAILPLSPLRLPAAELHQRCVHMRLLPRGRGVKLPNELRCLALHGLHLKRRQHNRMPPL